MNPSGSIQSILEVLTIFAVPKPFAGHIGTIQRNAIRSWTRLEPACQVIICGDEAGCREIVSEFALDHIPDVATNELGTPLLDSVFRQAEELSARDRLCYVNGDLILFPSFLDAIKRVEAACPRSLAVGETTNLEITDELGADDDFEKLERRALASGEVRGRAFVDFFVFPRGSIGALPDFVVGRPYWDNWMIWNARKLAIPVVDLSPSTLVVHQAHDYDHVMQSTGPKWKVRRLDRNLEVLGPREHLFTLDEATHRLTKTDLVPFQAGFAHRVGTKMLLRRGTVRLYRVLRVTYRMARRLVSSFLGR